MGASTSNVARATIDVNVAPDEAFRIFTSEIDQWWQKGTHFWVDAERGLRYRFEPKTGGRLIEVYDDKTGDGLQIGTIRDWEPGRRLLFTWRLPHWDEGADTQVEVTFTASGRGTRVAVAHSGWERAKNAAAAWSGYGDGWSMLLGQFAARATRPNAGKTG